MLDRQWMLREQRNNARLNLGIAFLAVVVAVIGIVTSARIGQDAAHFQADATLEAARMQIEYLRSAPTQPAPVVTIIMPTVVPN